MTLSLLLRIANFVLLLVNIALFCLWFSLIKIDVVHVKTDAANYVLNQVSTQVTILGVMVTFGALLLAGLGFFGFQAAIERAETRAEEAAQKIVNSKWEDFQKEGAYRYVRGSGTNKHPENINQDKPEQSEKEEKGL